MKNVCILDYGSGNVRSVYNLLNIISSNVCVSNDISSIEKATHLILPGVGSFGPSMDKIKNLIPMESLKKALFEDKKPFLGICIGMQVMADIGYEFDEFVGLGWISGSVRKLNTLTLPLPHVGWNSVRKIKESVLMNNIEDETDFYFVHSFAFYPSIPDNITSTTVYENEFCSMVEKNNLFGVQFHPEKSQDAGRKLLENFLKI